MKKPPATRKLLPTANVYIVVRIYLPRGMEDAGRQESVVARN